jgi:hypothetical protein
LVGTMTGIRMVGHGRLGFRYLESGVSHHGEVPLAVFFRPRYHHILG